MNNPAIIQESAIFDSLTLRAVMAIETFHSQILEKGSRFEKPERDRKIGRTTIGEIGPVAHRIHEVWNCTIFVMSILRKDQTVYIPNIHC